MKTIMKLAFGLMLILGTVTVFGQEEKPQPTPGPEMNRPNQQVRMLRELGLTPEQIQQIRRINSERRQVTADAQLKLRDANRALDDAIYSENVSEEEVKLKMKDVQLAQAEMIRVKTLTEYLIRKVLTPEQLEKFRALRERMMNRQRDQNQDKQRPADRIRDRRMDRPEN